MNRGRTGGQARVAAIANNQPKYAEYYEEHSLNQSLDRKLAQSQQLGTFLGNLSRPLPGYPGNPSFSSVLLSSLKLSDIKVYEP